jgi:hypothetical protein
MPGLSRIPVPVISWEWAQHPRDTPPERTPEIRLRWAPVQERIVHMVEAGSPPGERALSFLANVYVRAPNAPWPVVPVNPSPLNTAVWQDRPPRSTLERGLNVLEYAVRWVDHLGGEGPLSEPVRIEFEPER